MNTLTTLCSVFISRTMYFVQIFLPKSSPKKAWQTTSRLKCCWSFVNSMDVRRYLTSSSWQFCNCLADFEQLRADHPLRVFWTTQTIRGCAFEIQPHLCKDCKAINTFLILFYASLKRHLLFSCCFKTKTQA